MTSARGSGRVWLALPVLLLFSFAREVPADTWQIAATNRNAWDDTTSAATNRCQFGDAFWLDSCGLAWSVTIPPRAKILSAKVRVFSNNHVGNAGAYTARIRVEDVDNAAVFTGAPNNVRGRTYWSTTVDWNIGVGGLPFPVYSDSPDITALIQHIVDRPGWTSGNFVNVAIWGQTNAGAGGAFEDISVYPTNPAELVVTYALPLHRSVGITPGNLNVNARTVQITGFTATFSGPMPDNVGVGDVLVYNSGGNRLAFISGRTSSTVFTVADKAGTAPSSAVAGTAVGVYRAYTSLSNWEGQIENPNINEPVENDVNPPTDLVTAQNTMLVACYNDGPMNDGDIVVSGWVTGPSNYIRIYTPTTTSEVGASQRHRGVAGTGFRLTPIVVVPPSNIYDVIQIETDYLRLEGIEIDGSGITDARVLNALEVDISVAPTGQFYFDGLIVHDFVNSPIDQATIDGDNFVVFVEEGSVRISNSVFYHLHLDNNNPSAEVAAIWIESANTNTQYIHNVTIYDVKNPTSTKPAHGVRKGAGGTVVAKNVAVFDVDSTLGTEACFSNIGVQSNNVSSDATASGAGSQINKTAYASYFADLTPGQEDLHLLDDSVTLWGSAGADLDADPNLPVTVDIDGEARDATAPDIGADEVAVIPLYRSVGVTTTDLNTGARTVEIASTRATFSGAMPTNIGVGDVLQYQVAATFYVAIIHGRISSTEYEVRNAAGGAPQAAAAGTAVAVYRAYTSLFDWEVQDENNTLDNTVENFDTSTNLVTRKAVMNVALYGSGTADTTAVVIAGWTTDPTHYIRIYAPCLPTEVGASQRHNGVWDTSKYRLESPSQVLEISDNYVRIDGLQVRLTADSFDVGAIVFTGGVGVAAFEVSNSIVRGNGVGSQDTRIGINLFNMGSGVLRIWNNIIYDWDGGASLVAGIIPDDPDFTYYLYNNTVVDCRAGILNLQGTAIAKNNLVYNSSNINYSGAFSGSSRNNLSGPVMLGAPGTSPRNSVTVTFVNSAADDFHLSPGDTGAQDFGFDLSTDANVAFTGDIDLGLRATPWDIGADDVLATTAVELSRFTATGYDSEVLLEWETGSERDNLGFQLYRATDAAGPYERITAQLIPGLGSSPEGARYRYRDEGLVNGRSYYYELEDVEPTGRSKRHGPVTATPENGRVEAGDDAEPGPAAAALITYGDPTRNGFHVLSRTASEVVVELRTEGLYAEPLGDGTVKLHIPDFQEVDGSGIPVARRWVEVVAGRKLRLTSARAAGTESIEGWMPSTATAFDLEADRAGAARLSRRRARQTAMSGAPAAEWARIAEVGFQRDAKKALLELAPLRWTAGRLELARRLEVRLSLFGNEPGETSAGPRRHRGTGATSRANPPAARLVTTERGLYAVAYQDLFGGRRARPESVRLSRQDREVAYHLEGGSASDRFGPGTTLYFWSDGADANPYGSEAVYEVEWMSGQAMPTRDAPPTGLLLPYAWQSVHREENRLYQAALVDAPDLWLWDALFAPATRSYAFTVGEVAPTSDGASLSVRLQGASDFPASPDTHLRLFVNGTYLDEVWLEGKESRRIDVAIPPGALREGENELSLENVSDTGAAYSMVMLDDFEVRYLGRTNVGTDGALEAQWDETGVATVGGASFVLDVTNESPVWIRGARVDEQGALRYQTESGHRYVNVSASAVRRPAVRMVSRTSLREPSPQADLLVVGPRAFLDAAAPLVAHRRAQGLSVRTVSMEDLASEFGHGEESPEAIRSMIAYAYHEWDGPAPRYLLLLGDATYDPKDYLGTGGRNDVPSPPLRTLYLWTISDVAYASVNGDDELPDLAVGRIPASSAEEVGRMVEKILAYESAGYDVTARTVLVADNPDGGGDFVADAEDLSRSVLAGRVPERIYLSQLGLVETRRSVLRAFDEGSSIVSYLGHGGIHLWASEQILTNQDVPLLTPQARQPILLTMNCLNGYFQFPYFDSLSEELLKPDDRGVIAAFSPSGFSLQAPAHRLHRSVLAELLSGRHGRLGDAILAAQQTYAETGADRGILEIYQLLGDPTLVLH